MKRLLAALAVLTALVAASAAGAATPLRVGVADDWPKFHPCGDVWWQSAKDLGYQDLRITVQWAGPGSSIPYAGNIQGAVDCALLSGVQPILAIYPAKPSLIGSDPSAQAAFAGFVSLVGQAYPRVQDFIVGNEPNVNRFWQPQYVNGQDAAGRDYEHTLAQSYDALKQVRPDALVWGPAISSRGNDSAAAKSNPSHSPVWFIKDMGDAYRASGRTTPIFDEYDMHPYPPIQDTDPFTKPFQWPQAGAANLDRIKQELWDAFHGTGQPVPAEQGARSAQSASSAALPLNLDEVGEQTDVLHTSHANAYTDPPENVKPISEDQQAKAYTDLIEIAACDPDVQALLFFPLIDEADVNAGFQSGELYADLTHKASYAAVKSKAGRCDGGIPGISRAWAHTTTVIGAQPFFGGFDSGPAGQPAAKPANAQLWKIGLTAGEDVTWKVGLYRLTGPTAAPTGSPVLSAAGQTRAYYKPSATLPAKSVAPGLYAYVLQLTAAVNPERTVSFVSKPFSVAGSPATLHGKGHGGSGKPGKPGKPGSHGKGHTKKK